MTAAAPGQAAQADPYGTFYGNHRDACDYLRIVVGFPDAQSAKLIAAARESGRTVFRRVVVEYQGKARVNRRYRIAPDGGAR